MYKIEFDHRKDLAVLAWCTEQFGGPNIPRSNCTYGNGWYHNVDVAGGRIAESVVFDCEKDAILFTLKWA